MKTVKAKGEIFEDGGLFSFGKRKGADMSVVGFELRHQDYMVGNVLVEGITLLPPSDEKKKQVREMIEEIKQEKEDSGTAVS